MNKYILPIILIISILISGCAPSEEQLQKDAEQAAQGFAIAWQKGDYETLYNMVLPELQQERSETEFARYCRATKQVYNFGLIYDKVVIQDKTHAYAYYSVSGTYLGQTKMEPIELLYSENSWRFNALAGFFTNTCAESKSCNDYNRCTTDKCDQTTGYLCENKHITDCCITNSDCSYGKPYCLDGECNSIQCQSDSDCSSSKVCYDNNCVACKSDSDCRSSNARICQDNNCVQCKTNNDCQLRYMDAYVCSNNKCVGCLSNSDCEKYAPDKPYCDTEAIVMSKCVECLTDSDCKDTDDCELIGYCNCNYGRCSDY